jgi:acetyl esterase/lipase
VEDAMRAMRFVRYHKTEYGLVSDHIGIMGFSAGGHLAALVATESGQAPVTHSDAIDEVSARPDFAILGYPVITLLAPYAHEGSVNGLLGPSASPEARSALSAERRVTAATPPVFLFTTSDDKVVPSENSALFYLALKKAGVPAELHIFAHGVHGMGLANGRDGTPDAHALAVWTALAQQWMDGLGLPQKPSGGHH